MSVLIACTLTPMTGRPLGSITRPLKVAKPPCANTGREHKTVTKTTRATHAHRFSYAPLWEFFTVFVPSVHASGLVVPSGNEKLTRQTLNLSFHYAQRR